MLGMCEVAPDGSQVTDFVVVTVVLVSRLEFISVLDKKSQQKKRV